MRQGAGGGFRKIEPLLDDEEMGVYKRGRNSHLGTVAKNATIPITARPRGWRR